MVRSSSYKMKSDNTQLFIILGILALVIIIGVIIGSSYKTRELFGNSKRLVYLHMKNCPHCVAFNDEWTNIENTVKSNPSKYDFTLEKHDLMSDEGKKYATENKIDYAPAILFISLKTTEFDGNSRKAEDILDWVSKQNTIFPSVTKNV
jgi:hypothetical protein